MTDKTYSEAIKMPEKGWKYADREQTVAAAAQEFARQLCMNAECIYNWIMDVYEGDWQAAGREIHGADSPLICTGTILEGYKVSEY